MSQGCWEEDETVNAKCLWCWGARGGHPGSSFSSLKGSPASQGRAARAGTWPCGGIAVALELWPQGERLAWSPLPGGLAVPLGLGFGASGPIVKAVWELRPAQAGVKSVT